MKRLLAVALACLGCSSSTPEPTAAESFPLCDAEKAWLSRCPSASDCVRTTIAACKQVSAQTSQAYIDTVSSKLASAACDTFDAVQFTTPATVVEAERTKVADAFCKECRPGVADCVNKFYAGDDLGTGSASLILIMSDKNVHELNNRWPTGADAGTCEGTFKEVVLELFIERVAIAHCM
ncbi:MAG: hypothetical protein ACXVEF_08505 [Polyangiales bacterium]